MGAVCVSKDPLLIKTLLQLYGQTPPWYIFRTKATKISKNRPIFQNRNGTILICLVAAAFSRMLCICQKYITDSELIFRAGWKLNFLVKRKFGSFAANFGQSRRPRNPWRPWKAWKIYLAEFLGRVFRKNDICGVTCQISLSSFVTIFEDFAKRRANWLQFFEPVTALTGSITVINLGTLTEAYVL